METTIQMPQENLIFKAWDATTRRMYPHAMSIHAWILLMRKVPSDTINNTLSNMVFLECTGKIDNQGNMTFISDFIEGNFQNEFGSFSRKVGVICYCAKCSHFVARNITRHSDNELLIDESTHWNLGGNITVLGNLLEHPELIV